MRKPGGPLGAVSLCFISTNAAGMQGTEGFPRGHRTQTVFAYFRRRLRRALLFLTDHSRKPGTTIRGSEWGPASAWPHQL